MGKSIYPTLPSTQMWLITAKIKLNDNPAYAHSLSLPGNFGSINAVVPSILKIIRAYAK